jgi:hypothetical protein
MQALCATAHALFRQMMTVTDEGVDRVVAEPVPSARSHEGCPSQLALDPAGFATVGGRSFEDDIAAELAAVRIVALVCPVAGIAAGAAL